MSPAKKKVFLYSHDPYLSSHQESDFFLDIWLLKTQKTVYSSSACKSVDVLMHHSSPNDPMGPKFFSDVLLACPKPAKKKRTESELRPNFKARLKFCSSSRGKNVHVFARHASPNRPMQPKIYSRMLLSRPEPVQKKLIDSELISNF